MQFHGIDCVGAFYVQRMSALPTHRSSDVGRMMYEVNSNSLYFGGANDWYRIMAFSKNSTGSYTLSVDVGGTGNTAFTHGQLIIYDGIQNRLESSGVVLDDNVKTNMNLWSAEKIATYIDSKAGKPIVLSGGVTGTSTEVDGKLQIHCVVDPSQHTHGDTGNTHGDTGNAYTKNEIDTMFSDIKSRSGFFINKLNQHGPVGGVAGSSNFMGIWLNKALADRYQPALIEVPASGTEAWECHVNFSWENPLNANWPLQFGWGLDPFTGTVMNVTATSLLSIPPNGKIFGSVHINRSPGGATAQVYVRTQDSGGNFVQAVAPALSVCPNFTGGNESTAKNVFLIGSNNTVAQFKNYSWVVYYLFYKEVASITDDLY